MNNSGQVERNQNNHLITLEYVHESLIIGEEIGNKSIESLIYENLVFNKTTQNAPIKFIPANKHESLNELMCVHQQLSEIYLTIWNQKKDYENYVPYKQFGEVVEFANTFSTGEEQ